MIGILEICIGAAVFLAALLFGVVRMCKSPKNWHFSQAAFNRWLIFTIIGCFGGLALIVFGIIALL